MAKGRRTHNFKFVKNQDFKTVHAHGVFGGVTVKGDISMNFYVETIELPRGVEHEINGNKIKLTPLPVEHQDVSLREMQFGVVFDVKTAKSVIEWMTRHVSEIERRSEIDKTVANTI